MKMTLCKAMVVAPVIWVAAAGAHGATVSVSQLVVDTGNVGINLTSPASASFSTGMVPIVPPAVITMGSYQPASSPILSGSLLGGSVSWAIYSASGSAGNPPPSGTADTTAGTLNVDLSALRFSATVTPSSGSPFGFDVPLWPVTTPPTTGTYDSATGGFTLNWTKSFSVNIDSTTVAAGKLTLDLSGKATLVPVPPAAWLFVSGMLGLAGFRPGRA